MDVKGLPKRLSMLQRLVLVAGVVWFAVLVPRGISEINYNYRRNLELSQQADLPECAELVAAPVSEFEDDYRGAVEFRGRKYSIGQPCEQVAWMKKILRPSGEGDELFRGAVAGSRHSYKGAVRESMMLVAKWIAPLIALYGIGATLGWILRGRRKAPDA